MLELFSKLFGVPYPYPQYAQVFVQDFIFGGMENTSATTLTDTAIVDRWAADELWMDGLVAHELGHQWFGDYVTCRDWSHGWLNEGFATFMGTVWKREVDGEDEVAYYRMGEQEAYVAEDARNYRRAIVWNRFHYPSEVFDRHLDSQRQRLPRAGIDETLASYAFPAEHWRRIRTNNPLERILPEVRRRTRVVGCFPDGQSALMLVAARLRHVAGTKWGTKRYLDLDLLREQVLAEKVG